MLVEFLVWQLLVCEAVPEEFCKAKQLAGVVSNEPGLIGVKTCDHRVERVHHLSPAEKAGLMVGDIILLVDGVKKDIGGFAGETCLLTIKRHREYGDLVFTVAVQRVSARKIKDLERKFYRLSDD